MKKFLKVFILSYVSILILLFLGNEFNLFTFNHWSLEVLNVFIAGIFLPILSIVIAIVFQVNTLLKIVIVALITILGVYAFTVPKEMMSGSGMFIDGPSDYPKCFGVAATKMTSSDSWDRRCYGFLK